jgi:hypothetical protein
MEARHLFIPRLETGMGINSAQCPNVLISGVHPGERTRAVHKSDGRVLPGYCR